MKNFIITLLCATVLFSCNNKKDFGVVNLEDEKTKLVEDLFKAVEKEDIGFLKELFSKDMVFVNPDGEEFNKDEFIAGVEELFEMFENVKIKENNNSTDGSGSAIETTHYSTGDTWTEIWSDFSANGKYTGDEVSFPFYIAYKWEGNKIIREMQYFNPKVFDNEREAKNIFQKDTLNRKLSKKLIKKLFIYCHS